MLHDFMELNKLEKEQLIQLCESLWALLQNKEVTINIQPPNVSAFTGVAPNPVLPFPYPNTLPTYVSNTGETKSVGMQEVR